MTLVTDNPAPTDAGNPAPVDNNTPAPAPVTDTNPAPVPDNPAPTPVTPTWREDWRQALSKGDAKELNRLSRFASVEAVYDAYRNLETKLSSQKPSPTLPENATPEQLTEYRKSIGVPETHEGYYEKLPEGLVIGEEDKPAMDLLAKELHGLNASPEIVSKVVDTYYKIIEQNQQEMVEAQVALKEQAADQLRAEWGGDYRATINAIRSTLDGLDQDTRDLVENMQLGDGSLAFNHPGFMRWMGSLALQINPAAIVVPGGNGGDKAQSVNDEIKANLELMSKDINAWQSPSNATRRARHLQLLEAQEKFANRS